MLFIGKYRCKTQCLSKGIGVGVVIPCWRRSQLPRRGGSNVYPHIVHYVLNKNNFLPIFFFNFYNLRKLCIWTCIRNEFLKESMFLRIFDTVTSILDNNYVCLKIRSTLFQNETELLY